MSQLRRSARLASLRARAAQSSSVPESIPLDDDDTDSLCSSPRDSPVCSAASSWSRRTMHGSSVVVLRHPRCLALLAVAVDQEVCCPDCPSGFADHVSADWFQRLCLINGVEWSCTPPVVGLHRVHGGHDGGEQHSGPMLWTIRSHCLSRSIFLFPWGGLPFPQPVACRFRQVFVISGFFSSMGVRSILIVPLPIRRSIPSSFLMIFHLHLQSTLSVALASVARPSSNLWMTVVWSGHLLVEHPLRFLTPLRWMQHRALCVPLHLPSCLTDPLAVQCVSASPACGSARFFSCQSSGILSTIQC